MAKYTITSAADSGSGSLRQAIIDASNGDTIEFASGISKIILTSGEINIDKSLTINGSGADHLTISGNNASRAFHVSSGNEVIIQGISITSCRYTAMDGGGAILNVGTLTIANSVLSGNSAPYGGAIYNRGALTIVSSTLSRNTADTTGGAIFNNNGAMTITNSMLSGNTANHAGAIYNEGVMIVTNSTLSANTALDGGGGAIFNNNGVLTITNSTLSGNTAINVGGAICTTAILKVSFTSIAENKSLFGAGIYNNQLTVTIKNSIIANNTGGNYSGTNMISALGVNFDTDGTCPGFTQVTSDALKLGPLALNTPGKTETHSLLSGSVAIDSVTDCTDADGNAVTIDQRGISRSQLTCDAGSYEYKAPILTRGITVGVISYGLKAGFDLP